MPSADASLGDLLDRLLEAHHGDAVSVGDVLETLSGRSIGAIVAALGLIAEIPLVGAIPGVSITVAVLILTALAQAALGRGTGRGLWVPAFVRRREMDAETFRKGVEKARPTAERVDRHLRPRLQVLTHGPPATAAMMSACALLALSMIPLAVVPWGVTAPAAGLIGLGLAMMTRDGLPALLGYIMAGVTVAVMATAL